MEEKVKKIIELLNEINPHKETYYKCEKCGQILYDPSKIFDTNNSSYLRHCPKCDFRTDIFNCKCKVLGQNEILRECISLL